MKVNIYPEKKCRSVFQSLIWKMLLLCAVFILMHGLVFAADIRGFITRIDSKTSFDVGYLHVSLSHNAHCSTLILHTPQIKYSIWNGRNSYAKQSVLMNTVSCIALNLTVGSKIHMDGTWHGDHKFTARKIDVYTYIETAGAKLRGAAIIEEQPNIQRKYSNRDGILWVDGYPLFATPYTAMLIAPESTDLRYGRLGKISDIYITNSKLKWKSPAVGLSFKFARENNCVTYHAVYRPNGSLAAESLIFFPNHVNTKEEHFLNVFRAKIINPDYKNNIPGSIKLKNAPLRRTQVLTILPDRIVQDWVSNLGITLVPSYQKSLPDSDATKIHFRFYVVKSFGSKLDRYQKIIDGVALRSYDDVLVSMPNGIILIPDTILTNLKYTAQLVAILDYSISSVVQKQSFISSPLFMDQEGYAATDYNFGFFQSEQQLRIGIRQMYLAGYDIREAPFAWAVAQGKPVQNPIINSKHPDQEIPWYAAYAFNYISHYYSDVDYSKLKRGEREYQQFLQELYKADPSLPRPQTQLEPQASTQPRAAAQPAPQSSPATPTASAPPAASPVAPSSATPAITQAH